jgi:hypothetical protein
MDKREMRERVRISYFSSFILTHVFVRGGEKQLTHEALLEIIVWKKNSSQQFMKLLSVVPNKP